MNGLLKVLSLILTLFARNAVSSQEEAPKKDLEPQPSPPKTANGPGRGIEFKNNSERLALEYKQLSIKNLPLLQVILDTCVYCDTQFDKTVVITMIYRTDQEQADIYKDDPKYKAKPFKSPHQFWHGVDLRSSIFEKSEIEKLVNYLNTTYNESNSYKFTAMCHDVGLGEHFHIQFAKK